MRTIYKYKLEDRLNLLDLHKGAIVRHVGVQQDAIYLWVELDNEQPTEPRMFTVYGTGWPLPEGRVTIQCATGATVHEPATPSRYIGTVMTDGGSLVWHVYEVLQT
jgi:hypothetical protein